MFYTAPANSGITGILLSVRGFPASKRRKVTEGGVVIVVRIPWMQMEKEREKWRTNEILK